MTSVLTRAEARLAEIEQERAALDFERMGIERFIALYHEFSESTAALMEVQAPTDGIVPDAGTAGHTSVAPPAAGIKPRPSIPIRKTDEEIAPSLHVEQVSLDPAPVDAEAGEASRTASSPGKSAEPSGSAAPTLKQLVAEVMAEHPDWPSRKVASYLKRPRTSVASTMTIAKAAARKVAESRALVPAPDAAPTEEPPVAIVSVPAGSFLSEALGLDLPNRHPGETETAIKARYAEARKNLGVAS